MVAPPARIEGIVPTASLHCPTCETTSRWSRVDRARVASSEREFEHERFTVWRCPTCRCIHALEDVDLDRYYRRYGLHATELDLLERLFYRNKLRFIRRFVGLDPASPMLDLGCGNGIFVDYLRRRGYTDVAGYDPYSVAHADTGVLGRRYRLVLSTDVVEHVPSPAEHLERARDQVADGGYLYVQTPDAAHIDLVGAGAVRQVLQQPYHRHLVTAAWLTERLGRLGFQPVARTHRPYFHTWIPFLNLPTLDWYLDRHGGLVALNEPFRWSSLRRPGFWRRGLTGGFVNHTDEVQLIFRRNGAGTMVMDHPAP
jgi:2-polyprenyl-3-methyl-5-hydroxy-6-metoxy-1,4-benzoquinol methylase